MPCLQKMRAIIWKILCRNRKKRRRFRFGKNTAVFVACKKRRPAGVKPAYLRYSYGKMPFFCRIFFIYAPNIKKACLKYWPFTLRRNFWKNHIKVLLIHKIKVFSMLVWKLNIKVLKLFKKIFKKLSKNALQIFFIVV